MIIPPPSKNSYFGDKIAKLWSKWPRLFWRESYLVTFFPYLWLVILFFIPFLLVLKISLSEPIIAVPPYSEIFKWAEGILSIRLNIHNYIQMATDSLYVHGFLTSLLIAVITTFGCLVIGYLIAYGIVCSPKKWQFILLLLVVLPFWTSFLVRVYAWIGILSNTGFLNQFLMWCGIISEPIQFLYNNFSVTVGIIYCYLPFMILPIYAVLDKIDPVYIEAAYDLGCRPWGTFWRITFPLSMPGIFSGCALVFIPALGEFVIPEILGASDTFMIGRIIWIEFFNNRDWPTASAVAIVMLVLFVVPTMISQRRHNRSS